MCKNPNPLTYTYTTLVRSILTPVELFFDTYDEVTSYVTSALWDTGAEMSVISPDVVAKLQLDILDKIGVAGVIGDGLVDTAVVSIRFPNGAVINDVRAAICSISPGNDLIIGMDAISQMDFAVTNGGGRTQLSFAIPPFDERIDFAKRII
jgi:hypothetical protein